MLSSPSRYNTIATKPKKRKNALANNQSGLVFTATDDQGNQTNFAESQLIADLLAHFRKLTQVMIGEAISVNELEDFLKEQRITVPK